MSGSTCSSSRGPAGPPGTSQYTYIAYAQDAIGTGFSMDPDPSRPFIQFLVLNSPAASLTVADFTGDWIRYIGTNGTNGTNGINGAISLPYQFNTSYVSADPGTGKLLFDDPDPAAASFMDISEVGSDTNAYASLLGYLYSSTSATKSILLVYKKGNPAAYIAFYVTAGTDPGAYRHVTVNYISKSAGFTLSANEDIVVTFSIVGNKGDTGATGVVIMENDITTASSTGTGADEVLDTYAVPAGDVSSNGSVLNIKAVGLNNNAFVTSGDFEEAWIDIDGNVVGFANFMYNGEKIVWDIDVTRASATTALITCLVRSANFSGSSIIVSTSNTLSVNFAAGFNIRFYAKDTVGAPRAGYITKQQLYIEKIIK